MEYVFLIWLAVAIYICLFKSKQFDHIFSDLFPGLMPKGNWVIIFYRITGIIFLLVFILLLLSILFDS